MNQSNISRKNIARLHKLKLSANKRVSKLAAITLAVALVKPHKKRRLKVLAKEHRGCLLKSESPALFMLTIAMEDETLEA